MTRVTIKSLQEEIADKDKSLAAFSRHVEVLERDIQSLEAKLSSDEEVRDTLYQYYINNLLLSSLFQVCVWIGGIAILTWVTK